MHAGLRQMTSTASMRWCDFVHPSVTDAASGMLVPRDCSATLQTSLCLRQRCCSVISPTAVAVLVNCLLVAVSELIRHRYLVIRAYTTVRRRPVSSPPTVGVTRAISTRRRSQLHQAFCQFWLAFYQHQHQQPRPPVKHLCKLIAANMNNLLVSGLWARLLLLLLPLTTVIKRHALWCSYGSHFIILSVTSSLLSVIPTPMHLLPITTLISRGSFSAVITLRR